MIMVYAHQNAAFRRDKHQFFSQMPADKDIMAQLIAVENRAQGIDYSFLLTNQKALEVEFIEMFELLQNQKGEDKTAFWLYCYYCASLLEQFYRSYEQKSKEADYKNLKAVIKERLKKEPGVSKNDEQSFIDSLKESFLTSCRTLINAPYHIAQIRNYVAYANLCRLYWVFSRLTFVQGLKVAKELQWIDKLDAILGTHTDIDKIIAVVQAPSGILTYCSVGFFLTRFMIDAGLLIKHTFFVSEEEKKTASGREVNRLMRLPGAPNIEAYRSTYILINAQLYYVPKQGETILLSGTVDGLKRYLGNKSSARLTAEQIKEWITTPTGHTPEATTAWERFKYELYKRHCNFANDLVWATVNFLTNFNHVSGIPGPIASYLTSVFLLFDVGMALYKRELAKKEYLTKKAQYLEEIAQYNDPKYCAWANAEQRLAHIKLLNQQIIELELDWHTTKATFNFVASAAALLMAGFTLSLIVANPVLIPVCFFLSTVAAAMYLSAGSYAQYENKSLKLEQAQLTGSQVPMCKKEYELARNDFIVTMTKNTVAPLVLITTYAICWPAALALTAVYLGYELVHAYSQHEGKKAVKGLALAEPQEEAEMAPTC